ncbi:cysteine proteinase inhibitor 1-like [Solanum dulcamara]|uniref:cysteine proteinase inhibitor 1-like n=1 Tax=Solanum dulcamara TaxID=45834 RepID=UPI0024855232|nr:cysteine proteinase inhibitor 1-like [Solanum dulcamara]
MAIKFNPILVTLFVVATTILLHVSDARRIRREALAGDWKPITNITEEVTEIGQFAVDEHNKEAKTTLKFQKVIKGETQVVEGINYRLVIAAKDGDLTHNYLAVVWEKPGEKSRSLTSFKQLLEAKNKNVFSPKFH